MPRAPVSYTITDPVRLGVAVRNLLRVGSLAHPSCWIDPGKRGPERGVFPVALTSGGTLVVAMEPMTALFVEEETGINRRTLRQLVAGNLTRVTETTFKRLKRLHTVFHENQIQALNYTRGHAIAHPGQERIFACESPVDVVRWSLGARFERLVGREPGARESARLRTVASIWLNLIDANGEMLQELASALRQCIVPPPLKRAMTLR